MKKYILFVENILCFGNDKRFIIFEENSLCFGKANLKKSS